EAQAAEQVGNRAAPGTAAITAIAAHTADARVLDELAAGDDRHGRDGRRSRREGRPDGATNRVAAETEAAAAGTALGLVAPEPAAADGGGGGEVVDGAPEGHGPVAAAAAAGTGLGQVAGERAGGDRGRGRAGALDTDGAAGALVAIGAGGGSTTDGLVAGEGAVVDGERGGGQGQCASELTINGAAAHRGGTDGSLGQVAVEGAGGHGHGAAAVIGDRTAAAVASARGEYSARAER